MPKNDTTLCQGSEARGVAVRASWSNVQLFLTTSFFDPLGITRDSGVMTSLNVGSDCLPVLAKCSESKCLYVIKKQQKISEAENPKIRR